MEDAIKRVKELNATDTKKLQKLLMYFDKPIEYTAEKTRFRKGVAEGPIVYKQSFLKFPQGSLVRSLLPGIFSGSSKSYDQTYDAIVTILLTPLPNLPEGRSDDPATDAGKYTAFKSAFIIFLRYYYNSGYKRISSALFYSQTGSIDSSTTIADISQYETDGGKNYKELLNNKIDLGLPQPPASSPTPPKDLKLFDSADITTPYSIPPPAMVGGYRKSRKNRQRSVRKTRACKTRSKKGRKTRQNNRRSK